MEYRQKERLLEAMLMGLLGALIVTSLILFVVAAIFTYARSRPYWEYAVVSFNADIFWTLPIAGFIIGVIIWTRKSGRSW
jgi:cell division protein FtsX